jgi:hypothetical protein
MRWLLLFAAGCTVRTTVALEVPSGEVDLAFLLIDGEDGRLSRASPAFSALGSAPLPLRPGEEPAAFVVFDQKALAAIEARIDTGRLLEARIELDPAPDAPVYFDAGGGAFARRPIPSSTDVRPIDGRDDPRSELSARGAIVLPVDTGTCFGFLPLAFDAFALTEGEITSLVESDPTLSKAIFGMAIVDDETAVASTTHAVYRLARGEPVDPERHVLRIRAETGTHAFGIINGVTTIPDSPPDRRRIIIAGGSTNSAGMAMEVAVLPSGFEVERASSANTNGFQNAAVGPDGRIVLVGLMGALFEWSPAGPLVDLGLELGAEWPTNAAAFTRDPAHPLLVHTKDRVLLFDDAGVPAADPLPGVKNIAIGPGSPLDLLALTDDDIFRKVGGGPWTRLDVQLPGNSSCASGAFPSLQRTDELLRMALYGDDLLVTVRSCFEVLRIDLDSGCADVTPLGGGASTDFNVIVTDGATIVAGRENGGVVGNR